MPNQYNKHEPTAALRQTVAHLSATGMTQESIAAILTMSVETLVKYYRHEYDNGSEIMVSELLPVSMEVARNPDHKDSSKERHFLLERKGGFIKTEKREHGGDLKIAYLDKEDADA